MPKMYAIKLINGLAMSKVENNLFNFALPDISPRGQDGDSATSFVTRVKAVFKGVLYK